MSIHRPNGQPRVYSYIRFSTPEQEMGDSERRQLERARAFALKKGLPFDDSLVFTDRGRSGFHGDHRHKGKLGQFLGMVESGEVAPGGILVVENIDRLSREGMVDALKMVIIDLISKGIAIQTLYPEVTYDRKSIDEGRIIELILHLTLANAESKRKSDLGRANWQQKRKRAAEDGTILTRMVPAWLEPVGPREFHVIEAAAMTIRQIFQWKIEGQSTLSIERKLNKSAAWMPPANPKRKSDGWRTSYLKKLLQFRAVIGELQPHQKIKGKRVPVGDPNPKYYPPIVTTEVFHAVQQIMDSNRGRGGRKGAVCNLFTHLIKCGYCGGTMRYENKGKPPKGAAYFTCDNGLRGRGCARHRIRYDECEKLILESCRWLRPEQVLPSADQHAQLCQSLRIRLQGIEAKLRDVAQQVENLLDQIGRTNDTAIRDKYQARIAALNEEQVSLQQAFASSGRELREAEVSHENFSDWQQSMTSLQEALASGDTDLRLRMRARLRELIHEIATFAKGHLKEYAIEAEDEATAPMHARARAGTGDDICEYIEAALTQNSTAVDVKTIHLFADYVLQRRMSKEGRFLEIHFKSGAVVSVVPPGSLASGLELVRGDAGGMRWRPVTPDLGKLWADWRKPKAESPQT